MQVVYLRFLRHEYQTDMTVSVGTEMLQEIKLYLCIPVIEFVKKMAGQEYLGFSNAMWTMLSTVQLHYRYFTIDLLFCLRLQSEKETCDKCCHQIVYEREGHM